MPFAQLVIGSPGSGKSTYCDGMQQFMTAIERKCSVVNLDPANDHTSYEPAVDVRDLVTMDDIMEQEALGPNGGMLYALEELEQHFDWLVAGLEELGDDYILFDCPGQVELFTHHSSLRNIFFRLQKLGYRLVVVHLTDSIVLSRPSLYVSSLLLALRSMLQMELPHLNVLTKIDNLQNYGNLPFNLDFYTEVQDLNYLLPHLNQEQNSGIPGPAPAPKPESIQMDVEEQDEDEPSSKFSALNKAIVDLVEEFALVGFETLAVEDKKSMMMLLRAIDRAGGYAFGGIEGANDTVWQMAMRQDAVTMDARDVQERWLDRRDEMDEEERREWAAESREMGDAPTASVGPRQPASAPGETKESKKVGVDDDDMEDLEEMKKFMEGSKGGGVNVMLFRKRKHALGNDVDDRDTPARPQLSDNLQKRLFRSGPKRSRTATSPLDAGLVSAQEDDMSELVHFILAHEEAFQSRGRVASLYADFRLQNHTNPEGYQANLTIWQKALADAARSGVVPAPGATHHLLTIHTGRELVRALQHKDYGTPTCLPAVFQDAIRRKAFMLDKEFRSASTSIYKRSWVPSAKDVLHWGWRMLTGPEGSDSLPVGTFVVVQNVEAAAEEVLKQFQEQPSTSTADRILSRPAFLKRFAKVLNSTVPITADDLDILLTHLARDRQALSFSERAVKFKAETEETPAPITNEDVALADLRDSMEKVNAQLPVLHAKIVTLDQAAREAVQQKHTVRAKTALRSKKLAESALAHRAALALQLEEAYIKLQQAADQVDIVEAMRAGADAMNVLNQKVGGVEGVQSVMDFVKEQTTTVEEITSIINESAASVDEGEIDDELEAMEKAQKEQREQAEAAKTAGRLAELTDIEKAQKGEEEARIEAGKEEFKVAETSTDFSQLSVQTDSEEEQIPMAA